MLRRMRTLMAGLMVPAAFGLFAPSLAGCNSGDESGASTETTSTGSHDEHGHGVGGHDHGEHGHSHTGDDTLVWQREGIEQGDYTIALGHHGAELHAGEPVEPAVMVTKGNQDVADAKVFNSLLAEDGETVLAEEKPTVYEPKTAEEPAHYAQGELAVPKDAKKVILRFRVVLPEGDEKTFDVPVDVK